MSNQSVVWGSPKHWGTTAPVGSHGYAGQFAAQGWQVLFITSPITPLHRWFAADPKIYRERLAIHRQGGRWVEGKNIWEYVPWSLTPSKQLPNRWLQLSFGDLDRAMHKAGTAGQPEVVWIDNPEFGELFTKYPTAKRVLRIADRNQDLKGFNRRLLKQQQALAQLADLVVVTSFSLEREFKSRGLTNLLRVPNGVDLQKFQQAMLPPPAELISIPKPRAIFVGMIDHWFDVKLLEETAALLPDTSFVLIGRSGIDLSSLRQRPNIYLLGERPPELIPAYLKHADVGIIPFAQNDFCDAINPVKYYEYTAAGLPTVATNSLEFRQLGEPVLLARNAGDFAAQIAKALQYGASEKGRLQQQASTMSWESRWKKIMEPLFSRE